MKADMSALKEQMASMMEAMLGMRQLMKKNVATAAAVSSAAEADPTLLATVHHPPPNAVGRGRGTTANPIWDTTGWLTLMDCCLITRRRSCKMMRVMSLPPSLKVQVAPPMVESEMITMMVDTLPVFYYEKLVGYMLKESEQLGQKGRREIPMPSLRRPHGSSPRGSLMVQHVIDAGWLTFQEDRPNLKTNPLANHGGGAVNAIESDRPRKSKPLKDIATPRRTQLQKIPRYPPAAKPVPFPYQNSHAVPWRYTPPSERKEEATDISSLSAKLTNITGLSGVTRSGRVFAPPDLPTQPANIKRKAKMVEEKNDKTTLTPNEDIPVNGLPEKRDGSGKKEVLLEEASEFLRIIQQSEFKVIEQLNKTPARVSLLELLMSSEPHRALLVKVLNEAHVAHDISIEGFGGLANNITTNNYLAFTEEEIPAEGRGHKRALHVSVKCMDHVVAKVLIDNGSNLNVMPKSTLEKLPFNAFHLKPSSMVVRAFNGTRREVRGEIDLPVQIGPHTCQVTFQIMDINPAYSCLLGHPWIYSVGVVPSTLH
ncbi:hypothetical protein GmHk_02G004900 [Glycine max]|nr:hypothetical protein GmHk_02G004900 [Glycine max]